MTNNPLKKTSNLKEYGINNATVNWNLSPGTLQKISVDKGMGKETANGTLAINTGKFTGRSPQDRFLVKDDYTADKVWWGKTNKPVSPDNFDKLKNEITTIFLEKKFMPGMGMCVPNLNTELTLERSLNFLGRTYLFIICF